MINNIYQDAVLQPKNKLDERAAALEMLKRQDIGPTIVTMDRGYFSFNVIENCNRLRNCFYVIRSKTGYGAIKEIRNLPDEECDFEDICIVKFRVCRFKINAVIRLIIVDKTAQ